MNKLIALTAALLALSTVPAFASFGLMCEGPDGITANVPLGAGVGLVPLGAEVKAAGQTWTTEAGIAGTTQILPAQAASVDNRLYLDFSDADAAAMLVEIRLFWAEEETDPVYGGTLRIAGQGAWPLSCSIG